MTKLFYDGLDRKVWKVVSRLNRSDMTLFIHAITGNNILNYMHSIVIHDSFVLRRRGRNLQSPLLPVLLETTTGDTKQQRRVTKLDGTYCSQDSETGGYSGSSENKYHGRNSEEQKT